MARASEPEIYEPEQPELGIMLRPVDTDLEQKLTGKPTVDTIAAALRAAAFEFDPDDLVTIATADELKVQDADEYARGYELLNELGHIEDRITKHYSRFDKPLNYLIGVVRRMRAPQSSQVTPVKQSLSKRLGSWKAEQERLDRERAAAEQAAADLAAKAAQEAKAATLERVAQAEPNPQLAQSFLNEAETVRQADVKAAPVNVRSSVPVVSGGYTRTTWRCEFVDLKELMRAYVEGRCFIPDEALIEDGLQSFMDKQAANLQHNLSKAFPGTRAVPSYGAVARRR